MELYDGIVLRDCLMELYYRITLRNHITESYYRIILRNYTVELRYQIIFMKRIPARPRTSPETPGIPGIPWARPLGHPGTPLGPRARAWDPRDAPGDPWDLQEPPWTTKTAISQQIYSARSSRLLCSNLLVGAHRMEHSTGLFPL